MIPKRHGKDGQYEVTVLICPDRVLWPTAAPLAAPCAGKQPHQAQ